MISERARQIINASPLRDYLLRMAQKESSNDGSRVSPTGAAGLFQFTRGTGRQYGLLGPEGDKRKDDAANTEAMIRLTSDNRDILARRLGREPTYGELALAHQQGAATAANMITGTGNAKPEALRVNAVNPNASPQEAANKIMNYYGFDPTKMVPGMSLATNPMLPVPGQAAAPAAAFPPPAPPTVTQQAENLLAKLNAPDSSGKSPLEGIGDIAKAVQGKPAAAQTPQIQPASMESLSESGSPQMAGQLLQQLLAARRRNYGMNLMGMPA